MSKASASMQLWQKHTLANNTIVFAHCVPLLQIDVKFNTDSKVICSQQFACGPGIHHNFPHVSFGEQKHVLSPLLPQISHDYTSHHIPGCNGIIQNCFQNDTDSVSSHFCCHQFEPGRSQNPLERLPIVESVPYTPRPAIMKTCNQRLQPL